MRASVITSLFALAASVSALSITSQTGNNATVDLSKDTTVTWTAVDTDPKTVRLAIVNFNVNPPAEFNITNSLSTAGGTYTIKPITGDEVKVGTSYQFRFYGTDSTNTGIVAQSGQFAVIKVADKATQTTSSGSTPAQTSAPAGTTTKASSAGKVGAWGVAGLAVAGAFAALL